MKRLFKYLISYHFVAKAKEDAKDSERIKGESLVEAIKKTRKEKRVGGLENFGKIVLGSIYANMLEQISGKKLADIDTVTVNIPFRVKPRFVKEGGEVISSSFQDGGTTAEPAAEKSAWQQVKDTAKEVVNYVDKLEIS